MFAEHLWVRFRFGSPALPGAGYSSAENLAGEEWGEAKRQAILFGEGNFQC